MQKYAIVTGDPQNPPETLFAINVPPNSLRAQLGMCYLHWLPGDVL